MEAQPIIDLLDAVPLCDTAFTAFRYNQRHRSVEGFIVISGMGKDAAAKAADYVCNKFTPDRVVNIGICGALRKSCAQGDVFRISNIIDGDDPVRNGVIKCSESQFWKNLSAFSLATVKEPVMDEHRRDSLAALGDLVDMEGYAIAEVCRRRGIHFEMLKGVSDYADAKGKSEIKKNIHKVSADLAAVLNSGLELGKNGEQSLFSKLMNFIKFEHTIFSLPLLFAGAWIGAGGTMPDIKILILVILAGVGARSLGMAMNRIWDRKLDALNKRTAERELPGGRITLQQAYGVAGAGFIVYIIACIVLGKVCLLLSPIPLVMLISYSLFKRFTCLCHFGIGICLALAPLGAYVAVTGSIQPGAGILVMALFTFCWISGFDIIYSLQDMGSDIKTGVHSIPAAVGYSVAERIAAVLHTIAGVSLIALWLLEGPGLWSFLSLVIALGALCVGYLQSIPLNVRFFPTSAVAGIAGALIPILGELS